MWTRAPSRAWRHAWRPKMEIICDGAPGQKRPEIPGGCAVVATPRDASKQGGQDRVRTLSLAAGLASAPAVEPPVYASRGLFQVRTATTPAAWRSLPRCAAPRRGSGGASPFDNPAHSRNRRRRAPAPWRRGQRSSISSTRSCTTFGEITSAVSWYGKAGMLLHSSCSRRPRTRPGNIFRRRARRARTARQTRAKGSSGTARPAGPARRLVWRPSGTGSYPLHCGAGSRSVIPEWARQVSGVLRPRFQRGGAAVRDPNRKSRSLIRSPRRRARVSCAAR